MSGKHSWQRRGDSSLAQLVVLGAHHLRRRGGRSACTRATSRRSARPAGRSARRAPCRSRCRRCAGSARRPAAGRAGSRGTREVRTCLVVAQPAVEVVEVAEVRVHQVLVRVGVDHARSARPGGRRRCGENGRPARASMQRLELLRAGERRVEVAQRTSRRRRQAGRDGCDRRKGPCACS